MQTAQSLAIGRSLTPALAAFFEWYALFGSGSHASGIGPQHYFDTGLTWRSRATVQFDVRFGTGLNRRADDFYAGAGVAFRH